MRWATVAASWLVEQSMDRKRMPWMPPLSLRTKILASFGLVLLPVLALLISVFSAWYDNQRNGILNGYVQAAEAVASLVDATFDQGLAVAWALSTNPIIGTANPAELDAYLDSLQPLYPLYDDAAVFDANGNNVGSMVLPTGAARPNVKDRAYFYQTMTTNDAVVSEVIISRASGHRIVTMAVPLRNADKQPVGVVITVLNLDAFARSLGTLNSQPEQAVFVSDRVGTLAVDTAAPIAAGELRDVSSNLPIQAALQGTIFRAGVTSGIDGTPRFVAALPSPKYGWPVGVSIQPDVAQAPLAETLRNVLIGFVLVALFSVALALLLARLLTGPLRRLQQAAVIVGSGDFTHRAHIRTGDELEQVGNSFDYMAGELESMARLHDEFLAGAAHELKTPVTTIKGYAQLLRHWTPGGHEPREGQAIEIIEHQCDRLTRRIHEMLEAARLRAGGLEMRKESFDLDELADQLIRRVQPMTDRHRLLMIRDGKSVVEADRERIEEVLANLLYNAIDYSPGGGDIVVRVRSDGSMAIVSVTDQGVGIASERQPHVFEPFYEPSAAGHKGYRGVIGLGLHLSRRIVQQNGGRIWLESEEGKGSTFHFSLPRASDARQVN
ncbi:MAG: sensor histidine kinase [Chloroflexota bacterium]|nr:MAG: sensor histidine kinase [Chloroflexota bacterium]